MADTYDLNWLQNWISNQIHTDNGSSSFKIFMEVLPNFPNHIISISSQDESANFHFTMNGNIINGTFIIVKS